MGLRFLDAQRASRLDALCALIVPGAHRVGPSVYVDALLAAMPVEESERILQAIDLLSVADSARSLTRFSRTAEFALVRALAIEAFYSDFIAPGHPGPGAWSEIDFHPPRELDLERDWSYLGSEPS